jgi:hypothetical protein
VFLKDDLLSKNNRSEKNRLYEVSSTAATFVGKSFYRKISKCQKVYHQEKKIKEVKICQKAPRPLTYHINILLFSDN